MLVNVQVRYPRPLAQPKLVIGPFFVQGAYKHQGTIAVHAAPDGLRGCGVEVILQDRRAAYDLCADHADGH